MASRYLRAPWHCRQECACVLRNARLPHHHAHPPLAPRLAPPHCHRRPQIFTRAYETAKQGAAASGAQDSIFLLHAFYDFCFLLTYRARNYLLTLVWALVTDPLGVTCYDAHLRKQQARAKAASPGEKTQGSVGTTGRVAGAGEAQGRLPGPGGSSGAGMQQWVYWSRAYALQNGVSDDAVSDADGLVVGGSSGGGAPAAGGAGATAGLGVGTAASGTSPGQPELQRAQTFRMAGEQEQQQRLGSIRRYLRPQVTQNGRPGPGSAGGAQQAPVALTAASHSGDLGAGAGTGAGPTPSPQPSLPLSSPAGAADPAQQPPQPQQPQLQPQQPLPQLQPHPQQPQPLPQPASRAVPAWRLALWRAGWYLYGLPYRLRLYWAEAHLRDFELLAAGDARKAAAPSRCGGGY